VVRKAPERLRAWLELLRLEYQGDNLLAYFTASALALVRWPEHFSLGWVLLGVLDLVLAQAALELLDGYHDFRQGAHARKDGQPTWTGGSGVLAEGRVVPAHANFVAWTLGALAFALFLVLVTNRTGAPGLAIGAVGCIVGAGWAMPPLKLSYRGLGEVLVALVAGPLMTAQAWLVTTGRLDWEALLIGIPFGALQFGMAMAHGIVDHDADARVGKRTLVVRLGRRHAARAHVLANLALFASIGALIATGVVPWPFALVVLVAPLALTSARVVSAAASSSPARELLARSYPPYKLLVAAGLTLAALGLGSAFVARGAAGSWLAAVFVMVYAPVLVLVAGRWRVS
jgi:1,4-dihydroxy-2-naphthoate octaprenyltransferase